MPKKNGRPTRFTKVMGDKICNELRTGKSLRQVCREPNMPKPSQVIRWRHMPSLDKFRKQYDMAIQDRTDAWMEQAIEIADDSERDIQYDDDDKEFVNREVIQRSKLRVETRLKLMAKLAPKKYGDRIDITSGDEKVMPLMLFNMRPVDVKKKKQ